MDEYLSEELGVITDEVPDIDWRKAWEENLSAEQIVSEIQVRGLA